MNRRQALLGAAALLSDGALMPLPAFAQSPAGAEARAIAKEAYHLRLPDGGRLPHPVRLLRRSREPGVQGALEHDLNNMPRVYTPDDKAIQTPNSDTPYSYVGAGPARRAVGAHRAGDREGTLLSASSSSTCTRSTSPMSAAAPPAMAAAASCSPGRAGRARRPEGIKAVFRSETDFAFVLYRTQLFNPGDIDNVKRFRRATRSSHSRSF